MTGLSPSYITLAEKAASSCNFFHNRKSILPRYYCLIVLPAMYQLIDMKKLVAVVDDDQPILEVVSMILRDEGYAVNAYSDGEALLDDLGKEQFNLVLLDYRLPRKNGVEVARTIKAKSKTKNLPVILISANHIVDDRLKNEPIDDFIPKPFEIDHLMQKVHSYL